MSSIQSIQAASPAVQPVAMPQKAAPKAQTAALGSAAQEAQETPTQTKAEAAKGDQQAIRKLARSNGAGKPTAKAPTPSSGKVDIIA